MKNQEYVAQAVNVAGFHCPHCGTFAHRTWFQAMVNTGQGWTGITNQDVCRCSRYHQACSTPSDINEHLPILSELAQRCDHVTEFGRRTGNSTIAFIHAQPKRLVSYDNRPIIKADRFLLTLAGKTDVRLLQGDTR